MELPHIGENCSHPQCNQLDFLPIKCSLCGNQFCNDHYKYEDHDCPDSYKIDVRIPVCPLCDQPVPSKRGLAPDLAVNEHMENNCQSKSKKSTRKCSYNGCKVKELIAIQCALCNLNFCLRHRHSADHECKGMAAAKRENVLNGSIFKNWRNGSETTCTRSSDIGKKNNQNGFKAHTSSGVSGRNIQVSSVRSSYGESISSDALKRNEPNFRNDTQISEDEQLARAIALSLEEQDKKPPSSKSNNKTLDCSIS